MHWWNGTWHWSMMLGMAVFWIVVVVAIIWGIRWLSMNPGGRQRESFEDIVKRRYAAGEISKQEYEEKLRELRK